MRFLLPAAVILALPACAQMTPRPVAPAVADWRQLVTSSDRERLREWRTSFERALGAARAAGHGRAIAAEGRLLMPDAGIGPTLPNGDYRCRTIKVGAQGKGLLDYIAYPAFACRIEQSGPHQRFVKLTGSQRPVGTVFPVDPMRRVLLGTLMLGDEARQMAYAGDPERDVAGWVEQIEERRWRILFPAPRFESLIDVMELVPAR